MAQTAIEDLLKQCQSIYKFVVIASKRAKELSEGAPKFVDEDLKKVTSIALEEIRQGKVLYQSDEQGTPKRGRAAAHATKAKKRAVKKDGAAAKK